MSWKEFKKTLLINIVGVFGATLLKILYSTCRFKVVFQDGLVQIKDRDFVLTFWHGDQLVMPYLKPLITTQFGVKNFEVLISGHTDGRIVARAMKCFGIGSVEGSSTRGGRQALLEIIRKADNARHAFVFTPDGPRGPKHKVKDGVIFVAKKTNRVIVPAAAAASRSWRFNSWDSMMLPKPFSTIYLVVGAPICVNDTNFGEEQGKVILEEKLNSLMQESAALCA
jgi:lysophospholipid acyltransferase (LPLAT)-like uncharacterized protein